jgi:hypothetical protein
MEIKEKFNKIKLFNFHWLQIHHIFFKKKMRISKSLAGLLPTVEKWDSELGLHIHPRVYGNLFPDPVEFQKIHIL